jgi:hypothetical protein
MFTTSLSFAASAIVMNIFARLKAQRRRANQISTVPGSRINGMNALPRELWCLIIEYMVLEQLGDVRLQYQDLRVILKSRHVCRQFLCFAPRWRADHYQDSSIRKSIDCYTNISHFLIYFISF